MNRLATVGGARLRDERLRRRLTLDDVANRAGVGRSTVHRLEAGEPATLETYARVAAALGLRPDLSFVDPTRRDAATVRDADLVHAAMAEVEAHQFRSLGRGVAIDEPYQHFQFAGRADLVAWDLDRRAMLHLENRTRFPNVQEAAGSYNAKRAYFPAALADRLGLRGGWRTITHAIVALWSAEAIHTIRLRRSTFAAICPDPIDAFEAWWTGSIPAPGTTSTLVILDPHPELGRRRRYVSGDPAIEVVECIQPRYRGCADAATALTSPKSR